MQAKRPLVEETGQAEQAPVKSIQPIAGMPPEGGSSPLGRQPQQREQVKREAGLLRRRVLQRQSEQPPASHHQRDETVIENVEKIARGRIAAPSAPSD